ncbi:hypothetical protein BWI17_15225 [Betaproteobacteria bacterium GR16-43]|nr:hypothetical protein BWI17_15225 [Betaproteobacteria bacterium GR16-43]
MSRELAQLNIARLKAPIDSPELADFVAGLDIINALAEKAPGFVWRLKDESGSATAIETPFGEGVIVNLTVWRDAESVHAFAFKGEHADYMRRRREWFVKMAEAYAALWWVPAGHRPDVHEAARRLDHLRRNGPTPEAFTFREALSPDTLTA